MEEDWNISGSEDEGDLYVGGRNAAKDNQDPKKRKKKVNSNDNIQQLPLNIVILYKEIERNGVIELNCKCPRRGPSKKEPQSQNSQSSLGSVKSKIDSYHITNTGQSPKQKNKLFSRSEYQGFDYKDEEERPFVTKSSSAKKTPISGKRAKKTASMDNVFSDLIRNKMLDDLENATAYQKDGKKAKLEDKDSKVTVDFDSQESIPDLKEGIASQITRVETMLDSKEGKKSKAKEK